MAGPKRQARAALTSAPEPAQRAAAPAPVATPAAAAPVPAAARAPSVIEQLDAAVRAAETRGDHAAHAALSELHNAAGLLKAKAATRAGELAGADADLAKKVHALL